MNISLITIVKDEAHRLRDMLLSVEHLVDEIIVVDQGSTDGTLDTIRDLADVVVNDKPYGYSEPSIKTAVEKAAGPWILQLDADEKLAPEFIKRLPELLKLTAGMSGFRLPRRTFVDGVERPNDPINPDDGQTRLYRKDHVTAFPTTLHSCVKLRWSVHRLDFPCILHTKSSAEVEADHKRYVKILMDQDGRKLEWTDTARYSNEELARLTCGQGLDTYAPEPAIHDLLRLDPGKKLRILDFGAGMLRNTVGLAEASPLWSIVAYDTPDMLKRGRNHFAQRLLPLRGRIKYCTSRAEWEHEKFDVAFASLVFQHMEEPQLRTVLRILWDTTPILAVAGRRTLDCLKRSVWAIVQDYYNLIEITAWDHSGPPSAWDLNVGDPHEHMTAVFRRRA